MICQSCGATVTEPGKKCPACGHRPNLRARKQQESETLADQIASSSPNIGYSAWQRSVIMNVVDGGGLAGLLLVLSSVIVCCLAFIAAHRMIGQFKHDDGTPYSGGALFYNLRRRTDCGTLLPFGSATLLSVARSTLIAP